MFGSHNLLRNHRWRRRLRQTIDLRPPMHFHYRAEQNTNPQSQYEVDVQPDKTRLLVNTSQIWPSDLSHSPLLALHHVSKIPVRGPRRSPSKTAIIYTTTIILCPGSLISQRSSEQPVRPIKGRSKIQQRDGELATAGLRRIDRSRRTPSSTTPGISAAEFCSTIGLYGHSLL
jgi:hypothetical protein